MVCFKLYRDFKLTESCEGLWFCLEEIGEGVSTEGIDEANIIWWLVQVPKNKNILVLRVCCICFCDFEKKSWCILLMRHGSQCVLELLCSWQNGIWLLVRTVLVMLCEGWPSLRCQRSNVLVLLDSEFGSWLPKDLLLISGMLMIIASLELVVLALIVEIEKTILAATLFILGMTWWWIWTLLFALLSWLLLLQLLVCCLSLLQLLNFSSFSFIELWLFFAFWIIILTWPLF